MRRALAGLLSLGAVLFVSIAVAQPKTFTLIVGFAPGGGEEEAGAAATGVAVRQRSRPEPAYDQISSLFVMRFSRFLGGAPSIAVRNMPGAAGLAALRYMLANASRDGSVVAILGGNAMREEALRDPAAVGSLGFVGGFARETYLCVARADIGVRTLQDSSQRELFFGAVEPRSRSFRHARALQLLGARVRLVTGYTDFDEAVANLERRELDGLCGWSAASLRAHYADWLSQGKLRALVQFGAEPDPQFAYAPLAAAIAPSGPMAWAADLVADEGVYAWPLVAPPGLEPSRLAVLQRAFAGMLQDPETLASATAMGLRIEPVSGAEMADAFGRLRHAAPETIDLLKELSALPPLAR